MKDNTTTTMGNIKTNYSTEMMSLYEYLGKPAGSDLGKTVAQTATSKGIKITSHEVSTARYTGKILKYPKSFLDEYFGNTVEEVSNVPKIEYEEDPSNDELPF